MLRAAAGALPVVPRGDALPNRTVSVEELPIDHTNVAAYAAVTGLRYRNNVPLTYPFVLAFPSVMALVTGFDFPFAAMGSVHTENHITQYRPIAVTDTVGVKVHAENLREHRKGLMVDLVTDINVGNELAWHQVTTFLHQQRTSLSGEPKPPPQKQPKLPPPAADHACPNPPLRGGRRRSQPDPHQFDRGETVWLPYRYCARDVQRCSGIGEHRSQDPGCGAVFGPVRKAGVAAGHRGPLYRRGRRGRPRLGNCVAQHVQGLPAPDRDH